MLCEKNAGKWREAAESSVQAASQAEELGLVYEVASSLSEQAVAPAAAAGDRARARRRDSVVVHHRRKKPDRSGSCCGAISSAAIWTRSTGEPSWTRNAGMSHSRRVAAGIHATRSSADTCSAVPPPRPARSTRPDGELLLGSRIAASTGNHAYADQFALELNKLG